MPANSNDETTRHNMVADNVRYINMATMEQKHVTRTEKRLLPDGSCKRSDLKCDT